MRKAPEQAYGRRVPRLGDGVQEVSEAGRLPRPPRPPLLVRDTSLPSARLISHLSHSPPLPAKKVEDLESTLPSETALETNVLRYLANCLERRCCLPEGAVTLTSPTQREEKWLGFDAMTSLPNGRYVLLQFKRPKFCDSKVSFEIPSYQVSKLMGRELGSSFFVLPVVKTNGEMWKAKTDLLNRTLIVDAWCFYMPFVTSRSNDFFWFCNPETFVRTASISMDVGAARAVAVSQGRGRRKRKCAPASPISQLCNNADDFGFVLENHAVKACDGGDWDHKRREEAVRRVLEHAEKSPDHNGTDLCKHAPDIAGALGDAPEAGFAERSDKGQRAGAGGRYVIRICDHDRCPATSAAGASAARPPNSIRL